MRTALLALVLFALPLFARPHDDLSYIYVRGGKDTHVTATNVDVHDIGRISKRYGGTFLWVERDGDEYVIRDAATLAEIEKAFAPLNALSPELEALHERMKPLDRAEQELDEKIDAIEDQLDDEDDLSDNESRTLQSKMRGLERELRDLERRMRDLEREEQRLERIQDQREDAAERELESIIERAIRRGLGERR